MDVWVQLYYKHYGYQSYLLEEADIQHIFCITIALNNKLNSNMPVLWFFRIEPNCD